jgi:hypothetical protein
MLKGGRRAQCACHLPPDAAIGQLGMAGQTDPLPGNPFVIANVEQSNRRV